MPLFRVIFFFFLSFFSFFAFGGDEEITVLLDSENILLPTYVAPFECEKTDLSPSYAEQLRHVIEFDVGHNGMNGVIGESEAKKILPGIRRFSENPDLEILRKNGLSYLILGQIRGKEITLKIVQVASGIVRSLGPVVLCGDLSVDRRVLHQCSDTAQEALFGKKGVANTKIIYVLKRKTEKGNVVSELFEADYDGHNAKQLTKNGSLVVTPLWVPGKTSGLAASKGAIIKSNVVLYVSYELGQPKMFMMNVKNNHVERVSLMRGNQLTPALSSIGDSIAFCSDISGTADLYVAPFEASVGVVGKPRQIFHVKGTATACPSFSPDGKMIAFVSNKDGAAKVYIMPIPDPSATTKDLRPVLISKRVREATAPSWSKDGKKIVYSGKNGGDRQIWVYDLERKTEEQLTDGPGSKESPSFGPDSMHILFHAVFSYGTQIYLINLNQKDPVKIPSGSGDALFPVFEL